MKWKSLIKWKEHTDMFRLKWIEKLWTILYVETLKKSFCFSRKLLADNEGNQITPTLASENNVGGQKTAVSWSSSWPRLVSLFSGKILREKTGGRIHNTSFFVTCEWVHLARVFVPGNHFQPSEMKHSSLLRLFLNYKENEVLWIWPLVPRGVYTYDHAVHVTGNLWRFWCHFFQIKFYEKTGGRYSQHFIFCVTYEWVHLARVFVPDKHFQPSVM
jgi:hypothetical protein